MSMQPVPNFLHSLAHALRRDPARPFHVRDRWLSLALLSLAAAGLLTFDAWLGTCGFAGCPSEAEIRAFRPAEGTTVYDRSGSLVGRLTYVRRINVPLSRVPLHVRQAFIATEDRRFYEHNGLDWRSAMRASLRNAKALGVREGFSTITMQAARNTFTPRLITRRSLKRKLLELRVARLLERNLTKDQILELYLNVIYLGNGTFGVEAASRDLFGKSVANVTLAQAAMLAALPKGPSVYTPRQHLQRALRRRNLVLSLMLREGFVSDARARSAAAQPIRMPEDEWRPKDAKSYALDAVRVVVDSVLGEDALDRGDVRVYTTIDGTAQRAAERAVRTRAASIQREAEDWGSEGEVQGAMVALDPGTGDIRAIVGGRHYERGGFNRAYSARRQPGSAFKPFVYAAALASGFTPASLVEDTPVEVEQDGRVWIPANYGGEYSGRITMRRALMRSANAATVRVSRAVGEAQVVALARRTGITSPLQAVPSVALGALEVSPIELVTAYASFANGGMRVRPRLVEKIESVDGTVLWTSQPTPGVRVLDQVDAFQLTSMLRSVVDRGTGRIVRDMGAAGPIAGKTGTTNDGTDVWFVGYTPDIVAGFWFGYDSPHSLSGGASGGRLAAPAWAEFYMNGWSESDDSAWPPPDGLVMRMIDAYTGELAGEWCPVTQREWFRPGTAPTQYCAEHLEPLVEYGEGFGNRLAETLRRLFRF